MEKNGLSEAQNLWKSYVLKCIANEMTSLEAALTLGVTRRTVQYRISSYKAKGDAAFVHGNTGRRRESPEITERTGRVLDIFANTRVNGVNPFERISYSYFSELLEEEFGIPCSVSWVKKILNGIGYKTHFKYRAKREEVAHLFRPPKEHLGELVQADETSFDWFGDGHMYCIQGFVDDATGIPVGLYMTKNECLMGYIEAVRNMAEDHGLPQQMYPDRAQIFFVNNAKDRSKEHLTQFGRMMDRLGIDMFPAYSPEAKGRIERFWKTIKNRLPVQFKLRGITTVEEANRFLRDVYIPKYIKRFAKKPKSDESFFVRADMNKINSVLRASFPAKTDRGGVFSLMGYRFFCPDLPDQKIRICMNELDGLWVTPEKTDTRYECRLVETDTSGTMPEVMKLLIERVFLKNAKPRFREVYLDLDTERLADFGKRHKSA